MLYLFYPKTRMHSSRMRTAHSLTMGVVYLTGGVYLRGGVYLPGGLCICPGGVPAWWGGRVPAQEGLPARGVPALGCTWPGGTCPGGFEYLPRGVTCLGVYLPGGTCPGLPPPL